MSNVLPVLPLRDIVLFPNVVVPLFVGREKSVNALEQVTNGDQKIFIVTQKNATDDNPDTDSLYVYGTIAHIVQMLKLPDGTIKVLVEGKTRARAKKFIDDENFLKAEIEELEDEIEDNHEVKALMKSIKENFDSYIKLNKKILPEVAVSVVQVDDPSKLGDIICGHLSVKIEDKQKALEMISVAEKLKYIYELIETEVSVLQVEKRIKSRVKRQMEKSQREYYLNEQMKAIQKELGEIDGNRSECDEIEEKISAMKWPNEARDRALSELKKMRQMNPISAEATVIRNYLDWLLSLPWSKKSKLKKDLPRAQKILDDGHYGLEKVKERITEYLAVQQRVNKLKGPILCLVGPPGVGKTSLGKSIAKSVGREFVRISLGGLRDEAEIRGHRRTYIGSMPGKLLQAMKKAKTRNPLIFLDEIDKMSFDYRGDPASALLEVLDPEQNSTFMDHYLEIEYDLSDVMFVTTANGLNMPRPLLDRMEIIRVSGYTEHEKLQIVKNHMYEKLLKDHGLKDSECTIEDSAILDTIRYYTREAGVRNLEREMSKLMRKSAKKILLGETDKAVITDENLNDYLGVRKCKFGIADDENQVGVVTGLAWTEVGGDILSIESIVLPGKGKVSMTGKLGDVMKESIEAASSYIKSRAHHFGIHPKVFQKRDVHVHVPEAATPKDGPSAGIAMVTSIISALTDNPVRKDVAMTGEVTLRGRALEIGGLKEKMLAALRGGIKTVLIPHENEKDLVEIPDDIKGGLEVIPVKHIDEVLKYALTKPIKPIEWDDAADIIASTKNDDNSSQNDDEVQTH
ncbi:MAG: endopeptidase La [Pseudomonadota bacterium]